jgi:hypothetical protein
MELLLAQVLMLNRVTSLAQRSLELIMEPGSKSLYHTQIDPLKVVGRILHMAYLS